MNDEQQRLAELSQFLRTRRERLKPAEVGIVAGRRRRTPGLRREEVAQIADLSLAWYTFLEQGRPVRASEDVLLRLSRALRLDPAEQHHLFVLARGQPLSDAEAPLASASPHLQSVLDALPYPAYVATREWTVIAWNRPTQIVFFDYAAVSAKERNMLRLVFTDPGHRQLLIDWESQARNVLALFRASTAHCVGEEWHKRLVAELSERSPEFREWWLRHDVRVAHGGPKEFNHPVAGRMVFEPITMRYEGEIPLQFMIKVPLPVADTPAKLASLLSSSGDGQPTGKKVTSRTKKPK